MRISRHHGWKSRSRADAHLFAVLAFCMSLLGFAPLVAQSSSATLTGTVIDRSGAVVPSAQVVLSNQDTLIPYRTVSAADGTFTLSVLPPGKYTLSATASGFATSEIRDLVLNVGDRANLRLVVDVASFGETATVLADANRVDTSPAVATVIDRKFVENLPLNGRSIHALFELTPGVTLTNGGSGFSVNGQRSTANIFTIDGVSANAGITGGSNSFPGQDASGQGMAVTALGTTNGLVSVDALEEYRMETSTYAPQFGRSPGGQISLVTRSGTNTFHGSGFDYFRHDALDARTWLMNYRGLDKPKLRQHNYGGVLGGAIVRGRVFFFGSYEGLRLLQPQARSVDVVSMQLREAATPAYRPYVNALPIPNGPDRGTGAAVFSASWSDTSRIDSTSIRVDYKTGDGVQLFGRVSHAPSYTSARGITAPSTIQTQHRDSDTVTVGATWTISPRLVHDVRANVTTGKAPYSARGDTFGGAVPMGGEVFQANRRSENTIFAFNVSGGGQWQMGTGNAYRQNQWNIVDSLTYLTGSHEFKGGVDYRRLAPTLNETEAGSQTVIPLLSNLTTGILRSYSYATFGSDPVVAVFDNLSLYVQDVWRAQRRLTLTYGVRWEFVPPPHAKDDAGLSPIALQSLGEPSKNPIVLAPQGFPLWKTRYNNFAPRVGGTYVLNQKPGREFAVKGGFGMFHDLGYGLIVNSFAAYPFRMQRTASNVPFPLTPVQTPTLVPGVDPPSHLYIADPNLKIPNTYQWNASIEHSIGSYQNVTVGYVGARGRSLVKTNLYIVNLPEWPTASPPSVSAATNTGFSDYNALQMQYQRRMHRGIQAVISYTLSRSRDTESNEDAGTAIDYVQPDVSYGYSDFDVRHTLTAAVTYQIPSFPGPKWAATISQNWGSDLILRTRSGDPVNVVVNNNFGQTPVTSRPNVVPGQPFWVNDNTVPGGRRLNQNAFSIPPVGVNGDYQRGTVRGFGVHQVDLAIRREFQLPGRPRLQFRAEMFNLLNTPMYANPFGSLTTSASGATIFVGNGASTNTRSSNLSSVNSIYQIGGARSTQLALKLLF